MPRRQFNDGMEVIYQDHNKIPASMERELYDRVIYELIQRAEDAFFDDSFLVEYLSPTSITVRKGIGFQTDNTVVSPEPTKRLLHRLLDSTHLLESPHASLPRIDIVVVKHERAITEQETRKFKNASTSVITNEAMDVETDWETEIDIVEGTPNASPVAPATPAGYIKIAELAVTAVTGLSGSGAVTDERDLMPVAGGATLDTTGSVRLTAGLAVPLSQLIDEIDNFLKFGWQEYTDFTDLVATDPAAPAAGRKRFYFKGDVAYIRNQGGTVIPIGSGGGGGGGANWFPEPGNSPVEDTENGEKVWMFEQSLGQKLTLWFKVPQSYLAGSQLKMYLTAYSPSAADQWKMQIISTLIRKNLDAVTSVANQATNNSGDLTNTVANMYRELLVNFSSAIGQINSVAISPGDLIKLELTRIAPAGAEDTADIRLVPSGTEVKI